MVSQPLSRAEVAFLDEFSGTQPNPEALTAARAIASADRPDEVEAWCQRLASVVPHLDQVLAALPTWFTPMDRQGFVLNARVDTRDDDESVPLVQWLTSGRDPVDAVSLADAMKHDQ